MQLLIDLLSRLKGPNALRQIVAVLVLVGLGLAAWEAKTGRFIDADINRRLETIDKLRSSLEKAGAPSAEITRLQNEARALNQHRQFLQSKTVLARLWLLSKPFVGGMALWWAVGLVGAALIKNAEKSKTFAAIKDAPETWLQLFAWLGVLCGIVGVIFNYGTRTERPSWWFTFVGFPLLAALGLLVIAFFIGVLIGRPTSERVEADTIATTKNPPNIET